MKKTTTYVLYLSVLSVTTLGVLFLINKGSILKASDSQYLVFSEDGLPTKTLFKKNEDLSLTEDPYRKSLKESYQDSSKNKEMNVDFLEDDPVFTQYKSKFNQYNELKKAIESLSRNKELQEEAIILDDINTMINEAKLNQEITNLEAMNVELMAAQFYYTDENYTSVKEEIVERYKKESHSEWDEYLNNRDPMVIDFQKKQIVLLNKVNSMDSFPSNLSKEEYLRQEIENLKLEVYGK